MSIWDRLVIAFTGKRVGLLGPREVGKTVMHRLLREGKLTTDYVATVRAEGRSGGRHRLRTEGPMEAGPVRLAVRKGRDVPGDSATNLADWKQVVAESDYLLYLFNACELLSDDGSHGREIATDCELIARFLEQRDHLPAVALVGTHADLDPRYVSPTKGSKSVKYQALVHANEHLERSAMLLGSVMPDEPPIVIGSMRSQGAAEDLAWRIFVQEFGA